jgi:antirestriction protein ArdC
VGFDWVIQMIDIYQMVTDQVLKALEHGKIPWKRPWNTFWPSNIATGREYQGINIMLLLAQNTNSRFGAPSDRPTN